MAAKPENTFIASVHRHLPPPSELYRLKNHNEYNAGVADCWYSGVNDLWVEYKFVIVPKRASTMIDLTGGKNPPLSALQQDWLASRHREGRNVWVIVGCREGGVVFKDMAWEQPVTAEEFRNHLCSRAGVAAEILSFLLTTP